jgi:hypothetical protein
VTVFRTDPAAETLAFGWVPEGGWRWADRAEVQPASYGDVVWVGDPGPWLVPVGGPRKQVRAASQHALREFLKLTEADSRPARITEYASRFGWLGRPQPLTRVNGGLGLRGESLRIWLEELALLGTYRAVLDACDQIERSTARTDQVAGAQRHQLLEAQQSAALSVSLTETQAKSSRPEDLIRELRLRVRESLESYLQGQFSAVLEQRQGPVERFVPATWAAALELELARQAIKSDRKWATCAAPGCKNRFAVHRGGDGKTSHRYCSDVCRKRVSRHKGATA